MNGVRSRCLIPGSDGAVFSQVWKDALWARFSTAAPQRMNRTIKEATVQRYHYDGHGQLRRHLDHFVSAYNFGRRLKTLRGLTPYEFICKAWQTEPQRFTLNPLHQMPGLNT